MGSHTFDRTVRECIDFPRSARSQHAEDSRIDWADTIPTTPASLRVHYTPRAKPSTHVLVRIARWFWSRC